MFVRAAPDGSAIHGVIPHGRLEGGCAARGEGGRDARQADGLLLRVAEGREGAARGTCGSRARRRGRGQSRCPVKLFGTSSFYRRYRQGVLTAKGMWTQYRCPDENLWERLFPPTEPVGYGWIKTAEAFRLITEPDKPDVKTSLPQ